MAQKPKRPRNHILGDEAVRFIIKELPSEWTYDEVSRDYGIDIKVEIFENNQATGFHFSIQSKGLRVENHPNIVHIKNIKKTTINFWRYRIEPVILIAYVATDNKAYWLWFDPQDFDLTSPQKKYSIKIPKTNKINPQTWVHIAKRTKKISLRKKLVDKILDYDLTHLENEAAVSTP